MNVKMLRVIEALMDREIRPFLEQDGGNVEIIDLKEEDDLIKVYMRYMGACVGCGGADGTLMAIEANLKEKIDDSIRVYSV